MIGSVAMMLEMSFNMDAEAKNLWQAMQSVFAEGYSTSDLSKPGGDVNYGELPVILVTWLPQELASIAD